MKKTNRRAGRTLVALILDAYQEYQHNSYPKDPNIYVIRAHPKTVATLRRMADRVIGVQQEQGDTTDGKFMGFRIQADGRLGKDIVVFGPETIEIKWNGE